MPRSGRRKAKEEKKKIQGFKSFTYWSVSQVSIVAFAIGCPFVSKICPSTQRYSPFPSEAIESPFPTKMKIRCNVEVERNPRR